MRVDVRPMMRAGVKNGCAHEPAPKQRRPIVWTRPQAPLIKQAVIACGQRVVCNHLHAGLGKPAKLIEIPKRIKERGSPGIAATGRVGGLGDPQRPSRHERVSERLVKRSTSVRARQPFFRERGLGRGLTRHSRASLRERAVMMIGKGIDAWSGYCKQISRSDLAGAGLRR